jgi:hypothetical protein
MTLLLRRLKHEGAKGRAGARQRLGHQPDLRYDAIADKGLTAHILAMCGRVIQSSAPIRYAIVDGLDVRDSRVHNYPPRWNAAPS